MLWATRIPGDVVGKCRSKVQEQFQSIILSYCPGRYSAIAVASIGKRRLSTLRCLLRPKASSSFLKCVGGLGERIHSQKSTAHEVEFQPITARVCDTPPYLKRISFCSMKRSLCDTLAIRALPVFSHAALRISCSLSEAEDTLCGARERD